MVRIREEQMEKLKILTERVQNVRTEQVETVSPRLIINNFAV